MTVVLLVLLAMLTILVVALVWSASPGFASPPSRKDRRRADGGQIGGDGGVHLAPGGADSGCGPGADASCADGGGDGGGGGGD